MTFVNFVFRQTFHGGNLDKLLTSPYTSQLFNRILAGVTFKVSDQSKDALTQPSNDKARTDASEDWTRAEGSVRNTKKVLRPSGEDGESKTAHSDTEHGKQKTTLQSFDLDSLNGSTKQERPLKHDEVVYTTGT